MPGGRLASFHGHRIVAEAAWWTVTAAASAAHRHALQQLVGGGIAKIAVMLEDDQAARRHLPARGRAVVLEHTCQCLPQKARSVLREAGALSLGEPGRRRSRGRDRGHRARCACGPWCGSSRPLVSGLLVSVRLFGLVGRGHAGDGDFERHDRLDGAGEGELHRAAHLAGIDAGAHHGAEGAHVEEIVAHEAREGLRLVAWAPSWRFDLGSSGRCL